MAITRYCPMKITITAIFLQFISTFLSIWFSSTSACAYSGLHPLSYSRDASGFFRIFFTYPKTIITAAARKKFIINSLVKNAEYGVTPISICVVACCAGPVPKPIRDANVVTPRAHMGSSFSFLANKIPIGTTAIRHQFLQSLPDKPSKSS